MIATERDDMDITRKEQVSTCFSSQRPDIVINAAAYTAVDKAEEECDLAYAINRDGTANLAAKCVQHGIPLLHISTDYIFDGTEERPHCEDDSPNPQGVYGKSKLEDASIPWGTYHYVGKPAISWHGFAQAIIDTAIIEGMLDKAPKVKAITTAEYPTPAERPQNSVLDCHKIERELGISQSDWRIGLKSVLKKWKQQWASFTMH